jgi:hypothetical protein
VVGVAVAIALATLGVAAGLMARDTSHSPVRREPAVPVVNQATEAQVRARSDVFGVKYLRRTLRDGTYWISDWDSPRRFSGVDPQDDWFDADHGSGTYEAGGGRLVIGGEAPRMYIYDPAYERQWRDVEVTVYAQRIRDSGISFAGITMVARSNHLRTDNGASDLCDTRGYGGRLRFDGHADFEKETAHPRNQSINNTLLYPDGLPLGVWIGVKFVVYDRRDGVHLELWLDRTDGRDGGRWELVNEVVDNGRLFGRVPCAPGIDPQMALTNSPVRDGSESGKPNLSVYFRSDGIAPGGLVYKWASIREISP